MEILKHEPFMLTDWRDGSFQPRGQDRAEGLHWSQIVREQKAASGGNVSDLPGEQPWMRAQVGFLWEPAMEWAWKQYHLAGRPVEKQLNLEVDGIHMTPDGFNYEDDCLEEYKFTWQTLRRWREDPIGEFGFWFSQVLGYLKGLTIAMGRPILTVRFIVFWVNGDYSRKPPDGNPHPTESVFRFTEAEVEENWRVGMRYKEWGEKEGKWRVA